MPILIYDKWMLAMVNFLYKWRCFFKKKEEIPGIYQSKILNLSQEIPNFSQRKASWIENLQLYPKKIKYKLETKIEFADALFQIYICRRVRTNAADSDWQLLFIQNKDKSFPAKRPKQISPWCSSIKTSFSICLAPYTANSQTMPPPPTSLYCNNWTLFCANIGISDTPKPTTCMSSLSYAAGG